MISEKSYMEKCSNFVVACNIDNHSSGYLGLAVQLYVKSLFGPSLYLGSEAILPKSDGTAEFYCLCMCV